jgi:large subunit ribosomal protein L3
VPGPTEKAADMALKAIVGEKVAMSQVWVNDRVVPVTVLRVEPARIVQVKTTERDGYAALQVTFGHKDAKKLTKPAAGHFQKAGVEPGRKVARRSRSTSWPKASGWTSPPSAAAKASPAR